MADQSNEMVEKVARAICADDFDGDEGIWDQHDDDMREFYCGNARAAIEAMRAPTKEMVAEGSANLCGAFACGCDHDPAEGGEGRCVSIFTSSYTAALAAALSHDEVKG